jgi:hypothetical protein
MRRKSPAPRRETRQKMLKQELMRRMRQPEGPIDEIHITAPKGSGAVFLNVGRLNSRCCTINGVEYPPRSLRFKGGYYSCKTGIRVALWHGEWDSVAASPRSSGRWWYKRMRVYGEVDFNALFEGYTPEQPKPVQE